MELAIKVALRVHDLNYRPLPDAFEDLEHFVLSNSPAKLLEIAGIKQSTNSENMILHKVSFVADAGKVTGIIGGEQSTRRTIVDLISGNRRYGKMTGDIYLVDSIPPNIEFSGRIPAPVQEKELYYFDNIAYVPKKSLYLAGLSYLEMVEYSSRLRMTKAIDPTTPFSHRNNAIETLKLVGLGEKMNNIIPGEDSTYDGLRGQLGLDMKLLSLAIELVTYASVVILDDFLLGVDFTLRAEAMSALRRVAERGHAVICTFGRQELDHQVFEQLDSLVLISAGQVIYSSEASLIKEYFCSDEMKYALLENVELVDFLLDIASGTERPNGERDALDADQLRLKFERSDHALKQAQFKEHNVLGEYSPDAKRSHGSTLQDVSTIMGRAFYIKMREYEVLQRGFGSSIIVGLLVGYMIYSQGDDFTTCNVTNPITVTVRPEVSNVTSMFFLISALAFTQPVFNVHFLVNKLRLFWYERRYCRSIVFGIATLTSEIAFTAMFVFVLSNIVYIMVRFGTNSEEYVFFMGVQQLTAYIGLTTSMFLASIVRSETAVRDLFLMLVFIQLFLSGFPFQIPFIREGWEDVSKINPMRWIFEALMVNYFDGLDKTCDKYLSGFGFGNFNEQDVFPILGRFLLFSTAIFFISLFPIPNRLRKENSKTTLHSSSPSIGNRPSTFNALRDSDGLVLKIDEEYERNKRHSSRSVQSASNIVPIIFSREASNTGGRALSINISEVGDGDGSTRTNVKFENVFYAKNFGKEQKYALRNATGRCVWGKLTAVMGPNQSGKSSLLQVLSGNISSHDSEVSGNIWYNNTIIEEICILPPWQRCAYVDTCLEVTRDLTVEEVITFAMRLRCRDDTAFELVEENVSRTINLLNLTDILNVKTKTLTNAELRLVTIAEEIVSGASLLFLDEPLTGLSIKEQSVVMKSFREMVNKDKTVVATFRDPSNDVFDLFDHLILMNKGSIVYQGPAKDALTFFSSQYSQTIDITTKLTKAAYLLQAADGIPASTEVESMDNSSLNRRKGSSSAALTSPLLANESAVTITTTSAGESTLLGGRNLEVEMRSANKFSNFSLYKAKIVFLRALYSLMARRKLIIGAILLQLAIAITFGWIMGETEGFVYNSTTYFAISVLLGILTNIQLVFFIFKSNQVFLKECKRGLYSGFVHWLVSSLPLYAFRVVLAIIFGQVAYHMLGFKTDGDREGFYMLTTIVVNLAGLSMCEVAIFGLRSIRDVYLTLPGLVFVQFYFSTIPVKPLTYPAWLAPWLPSISMIRWATQASCINEFENDLETFPIVNIPLYNIYVDSYDQFLHSFGWGGKTKWYCLGMIFIFIVLFRFLSLLAILYSEHRSWTEVKKK